LASGFLTQIMERRAKMRLVHSEIATGRTIPGGQFREDKFTNAAIGVFIETLPELWLRDAGSPDSPREPDH
jgi:hypothetical protein